MANVPYPAHGSANWDTSLKSYINAVTPISPYDYGFVGDGTTDDTAALQNAINACPSGGGGEIVLPHSGNCYISSPLVIDRPLTIRGRGMYTQRIQSHGCDAIHINAGVSDVRLEDFELSASTRYSTTTNTYIGVKMDGTSASHINNVVIRNVYADGYHTAFQARYTWNSTFDGVATGAGLRGIAVYGLSVNNAVVGWCQLNTAAATGSVAIQFTGQESSSDTTMVANEGWVISDLMTYSADIAIDIAATNFVYISNGIFDYCKVYGIRLQDYGGQYCTNVRIAGPYIAMDGSRAAAGILLANTLTNPNAKYTRITDCELVGYSGNSASYGIHFTGAPAKAVVKGNQFQGFTFSDIRADAGCSDNVIDANVCLSSTGQPNIYLSASNIVRDNIGSVYYTGATTTANYAVTALGNKELRAAAAPTTGTWAQGDRVIQARPAVGSPKGWVCTVAGTPGTWVSEGNL